MPHCQEPSVGLHEGCLSCKYYCQSLEGGVALKKNLNVQTWAGKAVSDALQTHTQTHTPVECAAWKPFRWTEASEMKRRYILLPVEISCSGILLPHNRPKMAAVSLSPSKASRWSYAHSWCCSISNSVKVWKEAGETERMRRQIRQLQTKYQLFLAFLSTHGNNYQTFRLPNMPLSSLSLVCLILSLHRLIIKWQRWQWARNVIPEKTNKKLKVSSVLLKLKIELLLST